MDLGDERLLLYLDPPYYNTFDKYTSDGFDQNDFVEYLEAVSNKANWKVSLSNSNDFEGVIGPYVLSPTNYRPTLTPSRVALPQPLQDDSDPDQY